MLGIVRPVRRNMQRAAHFESVGAQCQERALHDAAFVVAFLRPRVRKVQVDPLQGIIRDLVLQNVKCIVSNQAKIFEAGLASADQAMSDTRIVHFDTYVVHLRILTGLLHERFAIAEADFEGSRRDSAEQMLEIERFSLESQPILRPQVLDRPLLRRRQSAAAPHERPN